MAAPITAIVSAIVPTTVGWIRGESLGAVQILGISVALEVDSNFDHGEYELIRK